MRERRSLGALVVVAALAMVVFGGSGPAFATAGQATTTTTRSTVVTTTTIRPTTTTATTPATTTTTIAPTTTTGPPADSTTTTTPPDGSTTTVPDESGSTTSTTSKPGPNVQLVAPAARLPSDLVSALRELTGQYEDATVEEFALLTKILASEDQLNRLAEQVEQLNAGVAAGLVKVATAEQAVKDANRRLADVNLRLLGAKQKLDVEQKKLRDQAVESYIGGGSGSSTTAALRAASLNDLGTTLVYANAIVTDQRTQVQRVTDLHAEVEARRGEADAAREASVNARDGVVSAQVSLVAQRDQQTQLRAQLTLTIENQHKLLEEISAKRDQYAKRISAMTAVSDGISGTLASRQAGQKLPNPISGIFLPPIPNPTINSPFGPRNDPLLGNARVHAGVDMNGAMGTPLLAPADGIVVIASEQGGYGNCTVIDHGNGLGTLYGHQSEFAVQVGDEVKRGQVIGYVGSTGHSTGPHLHWEVRQFGQPVNPVPYLGAG